MKNFNKKYKEFINSINLSDNDYQEIKKNILLNNPKKFSFKLKYALLLFLMLFISVFGIAFAGEIKQKVNNYIFKINEQKSTNIYNKEEIISIPMLQVKNFKELNYYAEIEAKEQNTDIIKTISIDELEDKLKIKILKSYHLKNNNLNIHYLEKIDNKVAGGLLVINDAFKITNKKSKINFDIQFNTKFSQMYPDGFPLLMGATPFDTKDLIIKKYLSNLETEVYFFSTKKDIDDNNIVPQMSATFIYDDIAYELSGTQVSRNILLEILETLKY